MAIKHNLECLAQIANRHDELEKDIQGFFGEAFFNILNILSECGDKLPGNGKDTGVRIEIIKQGAVVEGRSRDRGQPFARSQFYPSIIINPNWKPSTNRSQSIARLAKPD